MLSTPAHPWGFAQSQGRRIGTIVNDRPSCSRDDRRLPKQLTWKGRRSLSFNSLCDWIAECQTQTRQLKKKKTPKNVKMAISFCSLIGRLLKRLRPSRMILFDPTKATTKRYLNGRTDERRQPNRVQGLESGWWGGGCRLGIMDKKILRGRWLVGEGGNVLRLCDRQKKGQEKADWPTKEGTPTNFQWDEATPSNVHLSIGQIFCCWENGGWKWHVWWQRKIAGKKTKKKVKEKDK